VGALSCVRSEGALGGRGDVVEEEEVVEAHMHVVGEGLGLSFGTGTSSAAASGFAAAAAYYALGTYRKQLNSDTQ